MDPAWDSFERFLADMGEKPDGYSLERVDNNRGYGPGNCRWANRTEQARNTRTTLRITIDGNTKPLREWAEISGVRFMTIYDRINLGGWDPKRAVFQPAREGRYRGRPCL